MPYEFFAESYATERLKTLSVWAHFAEGDLSFRPAPLARSVHEQMVHQCLSEEAWFSKMLGCAGEGSPLPSHESRFGFLEHYAAASELRLRFLELQDATWFEGETMFFDVRRSRAWVLLRRIAHSSHHRGQLTTYLRLLGKPLYSNYGPTADTGGLPANGAEVIYRYESVEVLFERERSGAAPPVLPGTRGTAATERPNGASTQ